MIVKNDEVVIEIHYYSPPGLKRHRYFIDNLETRIPEPGTPSGILLNELRSRESAASGILKSGDRSEVDPYSDQAIRAEEFNEFVDQVETEAVIKAKPPKRRLRSLNKKIETLIYDDTAVKQGQLEDEAYELLNQDGFYDEILPIDYDDDAPETDKKPVKELIMYLAILFGMVGIIVLWVKLVIL